jgi:hypothetical protein
LSERRYLDISLARAGQYQSAPGFITEAVSKRRVKFAQTGSALDKDVFLSHSSSDIKILPGAVSLIEDHGASVYVDIDDPHLPQPPTQKTAVIIHDNIYHTDRLVVLVTESMLNSKWVPWELGLSHGLHGYENVALLPASDTGASQQWMVSEYFGLYPRIYYSDESQEWRVHNPRKNRYLEFRAWLKP